MSAGGPESRTGDVPVVVVVEPFAGVELLVDVGLPEDVELSQGPVPESSYWSLVGCCERVVHAEPAVISESRDEVSAELVAI